MIGLVANRGGDSSNATSQAISYDTSTSSWTRIPLGRPIKIGFMSVLRGKRQNSLLSSFDLVFFPSFTIPSNLYVSFSGYGIVLYHEAFNFLSYYNLRSFSIYEYLVVALLSNFPTKVWEDAGTQ